MKKVLIGLFAFALMGCSQGSQQPNAANGTQFKYQANACPAQNLTEDQFNRVVMDTQVPDPFVVGAEPEEPAARLAVSLLMSGVTESTLLSSIKNGNFAVIMTWIVDDPRQALANLSKISQCQMKYL